MRRKSKSKWSKYKLMLQDKELVAHLPETELFTESMLWQFLDKYNQVIVKPSRGSRGYGVIQVSSLGDDQYEIHAENTRKTIKGRKETYEYLVARHLRRKKRYIVQQRIPLATINGCPIDLRVMVQRKKGSSEWVVTGKLVKVANRGFIVTNLAKALLPVDQAISMSSIKDYPLDSLVTTMDQISLRASEELVKSFPNQRTIGYDIGIDQNGQVWIIEANFSPMISLFRRLGDREMYRRIRWYKSANE
ncbi:YheC/YheD family protein [Ammoniphilus resinae]|uniref:ATP-grasp domain-containing protein n=1 Tax=Ammoniphilus resinae TaxID=861532 RepID=A0ABS4GX00_9BACL|nr:YheC/YheD family protein [Ammoniphilus resinae]MBP1934802.1 hypothetical protein [Ammoniphilus resinae]